MDSVGAQHPPPRPFWPFLSGDPTTCDTGQWGNQPTAGLMLSPWGFPLLPTLLSPLPYPLIPFYSLIPLTSLSGFGVGKGSTCHNSLLPWGPGLRGCSLSREELTTLASFPSPFSSLAMWA